MKTLIFGSAGFIGGQLCEAIPTAIGSTADIADPVAVAEELDRHEPEVVVNCAGRTGRPNVDWCETHRAETLRSNVTGPLVLLDACLARDVYLVHISSGCLYQGDNGGAGFSEDDPPNFDGSFYSRSKAYSDRILSEFPVLILRPRMPFDNTLHSRSLFGKLRGYTRVLDAVNSLTYLPDFLFAALELIRQRREGIYNVVNPGAASPYQLMERYRKVVDPGHTFDRMTVNQLHEVTAAARSNCLLSTDKLERAGITLRGVDEAIDLALQAISKATTESESA